MRVTRSRGVAEGDLWRDGAMSLQEDLEWVYLDVRSFLNRE